MLLAAVFLCQLAFGIGWFDDETHMVGYEIAYIIVPVTCYALVLYRLRTFWNMPKIPRTIVAVGTACCVWFVAGIVGVMNIIRMGWVQTR